jgi:hypothetical protein
METPEKINEINLKVSDDFIRRKKVVGKTYKELLQLGLYVAEVEAKKYWGVQE